MPKSKVIKVGRHSPLPQTCGVGEIGFFRYEGDNDLWPLAPSLQDLTINKEVTGCGWVISSFTPGKKVYKDAYDQMVARFGEPLYQSEVRVNQRTNNKFFFCIFDAKGK